MKTTKPPIYIATIGRTYRRDTPSPKNTPSFHQVEALAVDRGITLADLKGTLMHFFRALFGEGRDVRMRTSLDRKSTRLNSSHSQISYAVFCLKKKKKETTQLYLTISRFRS